VDGASLSKCFQKIEIYSQISSVIINDPLSVMVDKSGFP